MKKSNQNKWIIAGFIALALLTCVNIAMMIDLRISTQ